MMFDPREGLKKKQFSTGAAHGSVLGADPWYFNYHGILNIKID